MPQALYSDDNVLNAVFSYGFGTNALYRGQTRLFAAPQRYQITVAHQVQPVALCGMARPLAVAEAVSLVFFIVLLAPVSNDALAVRGIVRLFLLRLVAGMFIFNAAVFFFIFLRCVGSESSFCWVNVVIWLTWLGLVRRSVYVDKVRKRPALREA